MKPRQTSAPGLGAVGAEETALQSIDGLVDPVEAAGVPAFHVARSGVRRRNKRTALLLSKWVLDNNGRDGHQIIDPELADLLVKTTSGQDIEVTG